MTAIYRWLWYLLPANPVVVRIVQGGSRRLPHLWVRMGYLGVLILLMLIGLLYGGSMKGAMNLTALAKAGTWVFAVVANGQVILVCLLAPLFMAGAIAQEQASQTYDILLTTPLSNMQIVLGSLLGRLFFILALLASGLPLFAVLLIFGGIPVSSIFVAFAVAALVALTVGSIAITMAVLRMGGRKAVYIFVIGIVAYLVACYGVDLVLRAAQSRGQQAAMLTGSATAKPTTWVTPLHPLLVLEAHFNNANYKPPTPEDVADKPAVIRFYLTRPLAAFTTLSALISLMLLTWSAIRLRKISENEGTIGLVRRGWDRLWGVGPGERRRPARHVWHNPIAWREANARGLRAAGIIFRWGFLLLACGITLLLLVLYHRDALPPIFDADGNSLPPAHAFRTILLAMLWIELAVIIMMALYLSASSVSREREDGTLDLLLVTPITPRQYIWGKLRGLVSFLTLFLAAPIATLLIVSGYTVIGQLVGWTHASPDYYILQSGSAMGVQTPGPLLIPEAALLLPLVLVPFVALCVASGMNQSLKAKGVLSSVVIAVTWISLLLLIGGICGLNASKNIPFIGPVINAFSPITSLYMLLNPYEGNVSDFASAPEAGRVTLVVAAVAAAAGYSLLVYLMIGAMVRTFDQTVRKLSGASN